VVAPGHGEPFFTLCHTTAQLARFLSCSLRARSPERRLDHASSLHKFQPEQQTHTKLSSKNHFEIGEDFVHKNERSQNEEKEHGRIAHSGAADHFASKLMMPLKTRASAGL
jgi:hypothetical protein